MKKSGPKKFANVYVLLFAVMAPFIFSGCGGGQSEPIFNVSGSWFIYHTSNAAAGEQGPDLFTFAQSQNSLTGTTPLNQAVTGTVSNLDISFSWTGSDGATNNYSGTVSPDGTTMSGAWSSTNGQSGTWNAIVNAAPLANITGSWNVFHTTGSATEQGPDLFMFTQSGSGISGTTSQSQQIAGTTGSLSIIFFWTGSDGAVNAYTGAVSNNGTAMSGTWRSTNGQSGSWRALKSG